MRRLERSFRRIVSSTKLFAVVVGSVSVLMFLGAVVTGIFLLRMIVPPPYPYPSSRDRSTEVTVLEDGWQRVVTDDVELCVPPTFVLQDPEEVLREMAERASQLPKSLRGALILSRLSPSELEVAAVDTRATPSASVTSVAVFREQVVPAIDTERFMSLIVRNHPLRLQEVARSTVALARYDAGWLALEGVVEGEEIVQIYHVFEIGSTMWGIVLTTPASEYVERRLELRRSVDCFLFRHEPPPGHGKRRKSS